MSHAEKAPVTSTERVVKESTWTEVKGGLVAIGVWEILEKAVGKAFDFAKEHFGGAVKDATTEILINAVKKPFEEIRDEHYMYIQYYLKAAYPEAAEGLLRHIHRWRRRHGLGDYRVNAVLMGLYKSLQELSEKTGRTQVFRTIGLMSDAEFDEMVEDLTHDPVKQFFAWLKAQPLWRQALGFWRTGNRKAFWGVMLIMGEPVVLILFGLAAGFFLHRHFVSWPLLLLGFLGLGSAAAWGIIHLNEWRTQPEREANEAEEADGQPHEARTREFPWKSVFGWGAMGLILPAMFLALSQDDKGLDWLYIVPWFIGAALLAGVLWLIFSDHPIAALGVHFAGRVPRYGAPVRVGLYGLGSVIGADFIFTVLFPFFHFEQHNRLAILALGLILFFYLSTYTFHRAYQAMAFAALLGMLLYGLLNAEGKGWYEKAAHWLESKPAKTVVVERQLPSPAISPAEVRPSKVEPQAKRAEPAPVPASTATVPEEVYAPDAERASFREAARVPRFVREELPIGGIFEGQVVPCYMGDLPDANHGQGRLCLREADGKVIGAHYDLDALIQAPDYPGRTPFTVPWLARNSVVRICIAGGHIRSGVLLQGEAPRG